MLKIAILALLSSATAAYAQLQAPADATNAQTRPEQSVDADLLQALACLPELNGIYWVRLRRPSCNPPAMAAEQNKKLVSLLERRYGRPINVEQMERDNETYAKERQAMLKASKAKAVDFSDAVLLMSPVKSLAEIMASPMLTPDNAVYAGRVILDAQESKEVLRGKLQARGAVAYVMLRISGKSVVLDKDAMRLNQRVGVVGRYVGNVKYQTVAGELKVAPVIEITHVGDPMEPSL
jgi:hypothetical protein